MLHINNESSTDIYLMLFKKIEFLGKKKHNASLFRHWLWKNPLSHFLRYRYINVSVLSQSHKNQQQKKNTFLHFHLPTRVKEGSKSSIHRFVFSNSNFFDT
jgi:CRISPR/Cas system CSM-associated protein Csm4 (group 5 of RAMP superfamily)